MTDPNTDSAFDAWKDGDTLDPQGFTYSERREMSGDALHSDRNLARLAWDCPARQAARAAMARRGEAW